MLNDPLLSVVIPFLNEEARLGACLRAVQAQTFGAERFETILIDNGSRDRSAEIARSFAGTTVLSEPRRDPYVARNRGIQAARGRYIVFLDADCIADPRWLEEMWREIETSQAPIVLGYLSYPDGVSSLLRRHEHYYDAKLRFLLDHRLERHYFGHAGNMAVRRDVFERLGPFPPMPIVGDTEIIHRLLREWPESTLSYAAGAKVIHSEVTTFGECLQKLYECGIYSETYTRVSQYRVVPAIVKWRIFQHMVTNGRHGPRAALETFAALAFGWAWFQWGRLRARALAASLSGSH